VFRRRQRRSAPPLTTNTNPMTKVAVAFAPVRPSSESSPSTPVGSRRGSVVGAHVIGAHVIGAHVVGAHVVGAHVVGAHVTLSVFDDLIEDLGNLGVRLTRTGPAVASGLLLMAGQVCRYIAKMDEAV